MFKKFSLMKKHKKSKLINLMNKIKMNKIKVYILIF